MRSVSARQDLSTPSSPPRSRLSNSPIGRSRHTIPSPSFHFPIGVEPSSPTSHRTNPASSRTRQTESSPRHQHEIQPPSRRLSSHQMLLLTPFGDMIPEEAIESGETSMAGASSSMSRGLSRIGGGGASITAREVALNPRRPHARLRSLPSGQSGSLASAPMATIPSATDSEVSESEARDVVQVPPGASMYPSFIGDHLSTIPMTRSTSSPVMSMKSLEALKLKDGELGIARGGMWAWVSHDVPDSTALASFPPSGPSRTHSSFPPSSDGITHPMFRDPFTATPLSASTMTRESPPGSSSPSYATHQATAVGYHYSPDEAEGRRMSEAPIPGVSTTAAKALMALRRPSVPLNVLLQTSRRSSLLSLPPTTSLDIPQDTSQAFDPSTSTAVPSPSALPAHKLTRYRSLPDRRLNLAFKMQDPEVGIRASRGSVDDRQQLVRAVRPTSSNVSPTNQPKRPSPTAGAWAAVDVVDSVAAPNSESIDRRNSVSPTSPLPDLPSGADHPISNPQFSFGNLAPPVPQRRRWDSVDSGFPTPHEPSGLQVSIGPLSETDWSAPFPRRGSLMVLTKTPLAPWASIERSGISVELGQAAWTERRGSWVDEWDLKGR